MQPHLDTPRTVSGPAAMTQPVVWSAAPKKRHLHRLRPPLAESLPCRYLLLHDLETLPLSCRGHRWLDESPAAVGDQRPSRIGRRWSWRPAGPSLPARFCPHRRRRGLVSNTLRNSRLGHFPRLGPKRLSCQKRCRAGPGYCSLTAPLTQARLPKCTQSAEVNLAQAERA